MAYGSAGAFGFRPVDNLISSQWSGTTHAYSIDPTYATSIFVGDLVVMARQTTGNPAIPNRNFGYINKYTTGTNVTPPLGVFMGCQFNPSNTSEYGGNKNAWIAGTQVYSGIVTAYIADDPNLIMEVVTSNTAGTGPTALTLAMLFQNAKPSAVTTGNAGSGQSNLTLDLQTVATTNTLPIQIIGLGGDPQNALGQDYNVALVRFNRHQFMNGPGIAGLA